MNTFHVSYILLIWLYVHSQTALRFAADEGVFMLFMLYCPTVLFFFFFYLLTYWFGYDACLKWVQSDKMFVFPWAISFPHYNAVAQVEGVLKVVALWIFSFWLRALLLSYTWLHAVKSFDPIL